MLIFQSTHQPIPPQPHNLIPIPAARQPFDLLWPVHSLGKMDVQCPDCGALHWMAERLAQSSNTRPRFGMYCFQGKIKLAPLHNLPLELSNLYTSQTPQAKGFRENIRRYNNALAMTSLGCKVDESVNRGNGPYMFKIQGRLSHLAGSLLPQEGESPVYAQLYIYDPAEALDHRMRHEANQNLNRQIMAELQDMLYRLHPATQLYKQAYEITREMPNHQQCRIALRYGRNAISGAIIFQLLLLMRLLLFFLAMVMRCRIQGISFSTAIMARAFSVSVIFIHFIRLYIMSFFFQLGNLDGLRVFLTLAEKMKGPGVKVLMMEMHQMASAPV